MARPKPSLEVHFLVPCRAVPWNGPAGPLTSRNLEEVSYTYHTDPPNTFPYETEFWLFARLAHHRPRVFTRELRVTLIWHDDPQRRPRVCTRPFQTTTFRPSVPVRDVAVTFSAVYEGPGRYEFRLWYPVVRKWDQRTKRRILACAWIRVEG
jgi:hypothetical protein